MPHYLYQMSYSRDAVKGMIANPTDREAAARQVTEAAGGKLKAFYFSFGSNDVVVIAEAPNDETMAAVSLAVAASGAASSGSITKLLTAQEGMEAMKLAGKAAAGYKPPMAADRASRFGGADEIERAHEAKVSNGSCRESPCGVSS